MIPLGAFDLQSPLGKGGMGEVWRGIHRGQQVPVPVAVKLLTNELARKEAYRAAFRNEVRAVAGLDHPNIVMVFDYGTVDAQGQEASGGTLRAGTPWLAMELAEEGSLDDPRHVQSWEQLRAVLLSLLDALAHAHARGVIHRDIKPANVLVGSGHGRVKLTDFGLAHAMNGEHKDFVAGTPSYMAPEQFEGRWRDYGAWTDLYAVGCLVYSLCTGAPPFGLLGEWNVGLQAHKTLPVPLLRSHFAVPPGFEAWVHRLMAKQPGQRWRRAADASWALLSLPEHIGGTVIGQSYDARVLEATRVADVATRPANFSGLSTPSTAMTQAPGVAGSDLTQVDAARAELATAVRPTVPRASDATVPTPGGAETWGPADLGSDAGRSSPPAVAPPPVRLTRAAPGGSVTQFGRTQPDVAPVAVPLPPSDVPPLPADWRRPTPPRRSLRILGAGLGLFGLRSIPLVGRQTERDELWQMFSQCRRDSQPRAVLVQGASGCGKSRLALWLCERAHEVGGAHVLRATHTVECSPSDGLGPMICSNLRCAGLDHDQIVGRISGWLSSLGVQAIEESEALADLIQPHANPDDGARPTARGRVGTIARHLARLCVERPVVVWLDDVQWGPESIALAQRLLDEDFDGAPIFVVLTCRDEELTERQAASARLAGLMESERTSWMSLGALDPEHRAVLVRQILMLEGDLAFEVERRTAGNPQFAIQLVGDWVHRGLLEPGRKGFRLRDGAVADVPDDLQQVWSDRVSLTVRSQLFADRVALELAAVLAMDVDWEEWTAVCELGEVRASGGLVETLLTRNLARCGSGGPREGWTFAHSLVRSCLEQMAREAGRLKDLHRLCAAMLLDVSGSGIAERRARHLIAAGELGQAIDPLLVAIDERLVTGHYSMANLLLVERERALEATEAVWNGRACVENWLRWARLAAAVGKVGDATAWISRVEQQARAQRFGRMLVDSLLLQGRLARLRGEGASTWRILFEAEQLAHGDPTRWRLGLVQLEMGRQLVQRGGLMRAAELLRESRENLEYAQDHGGMAEAFVVFADLALQGGRFGAASVLLDWASSRSAWLGSRIGEGLCALFSARLFRMRGDLRGAEACARDALDILRTLGAWQVSCVEQELALLDIAHGRHGAARDRLEPALRTFVLQEMSGHAGYAHLVMCAACLGASDVRGLRRHADKAQRLLADTGVVSLDARRIAERAAVDAMAAGLVDEALVLQQIAAAQGAVLDKASRDRAA